MALCRAPKLTDKDIKDLGGIIEARFRYTLYTVIDDGSANGMAPVDIAVNVSQTIDAFRYVKDPLVVWNAALGNKKEIQVLMKTDLYEQFYGLVTDSINLEKVFGDKKEEFKILVAGRERLLRILEDSPTIETETGDLRDLGSTKLPPKTLLN